MGKREIAMFRREERTGFQKGKGKREKGDKI